MNGAEFCHEVDGCPGLYVDAFRGKYLRRTQDPDNAFILTHYHGDHYQNLPRDGKYQGLALIHCTSVTAALLTQVHGIPEMWVIGHEYGQTFSYKIKGQNGKQVAITFYDANHCPGACIVVIQLPDGTTHLHTGDMRYHEKFKSYPLLLDAVNAKKLDIVYLDTTYSHPKHDFIPQEEAVQEIADTVVQLLGPSASETNSKQAKTLVLLSCYSIGKEKVLWESATRTNQLVFVTEKKMRMLQCVEGHEEVSSQIIRRCTQDSTQTPIHVIPMGLAGELWPFFRPNFQKCAEYAQNLEQGYDKVVAFLPTGWAHGSKWNREHAVSQKTVPLEGNSIHVEVRLIPYSEHSAFKELVSFVQFLRPRKVIPTVFSDQADYRKIENRFRNLLDIKRAKQAFIGSMKAKPVDPNDSSKEPLYSTDDGNDQSGVAPSKQSATPTIGSGSCPEAATEGQGENATCYQSDDSVEIVNVKGASPSKGESPLSDKDHQVSCLVAMGFPWDLARQVLQDCEGDMDQAVDRLLCGPTVTNRGTGTRATKDASVSFSGSPEISLSKSNKRQKTTSSPKLAPSQGTTLHITSFFTKKTG